MRPHRVVVTGMGAVTPLGLSVAALREGLLAGRSGVGPITLFDPGALVTRIAAEVPLATSALEHRDRKLAFALRAAHEAMTDAAQCGSALGDGDGRAGGVSLGVGLELFSMDDMVALRAGASPPSGTLRARLSFLQVPSDLAVHHLAWRYGLACPPRLHVSACAAGTDALGAAFHAVADGRWRWALAGGTDSMINPLGVAGFCVLTAMSTRNDDPARASRPFDRTRDGFVLGEGAAVLTLERRDDALRRGARIHAEVVGYGCSFDAHNITEPHPEGAGALAAMRRALADAGLSPDDIDAVNAHGTSTPKNDPAETAALKSLFGARATRVPVSATKSMIGHLISAAGAVEAVAAIATMELGMVHPTINLREPDPRCDLDYVTEGARRVAQRYVLSTSYGFGGQNAALVLAHPEAR